MGKIKFSKNIFEELINLISIIIDFITFLIFFTLENFSFYA